jgi:hypothetical protein
LNPWLEADAVPLAAASSAFCEQAQIGGGCFPPKAAFVLCQICPGFMTVN